VFHCNEGMDLCQHCRVQLNKLLRCSQCKKVLYCSITCQRDDWRKHRKDCIRTDRGQQLDDFTFQNATIRNKTEHCDVVMLTRDHDNNEDIFNDSSVQNNSTGTLPNGEMIKRLDQQNVVQKMLWNFYLEDMENLFCYHILLRPNLETRVKLKLEDIILSIRRSDPYDTMRHTVFISCPIPGRPKPVQEIGIEFPRSFIPDSHRVFLVDDDEAISIRISYSKIANLRNRKDIISSHCISLEDIQNICCSNCNSNLCIPAISKILPLPSGRFDAIDDYLMCYTGDQTIDFSTSAMSAQSGMILEDDISFVLHRSDVSETVCVLSTIGYGQPEDFIFNIMRSKGVMDTRASLLSLDSMADGYQGPMLRGMRQWNDNVGGMPLTCSLCATVLGVAHRSSPDVYRLLKHRLHRSIPVSSTRSLEACNQKLLSTSSFIINEMVRYAETQAVFAFEIMTADDKLALKSDKNMLVHKCLRLRMLGWDSIICDNSDFIVNADGNFTVLKWSRSAKVTFETLSVQLQQSDILLQEFDNAWMLNNVDWCCPPIDDVTVVGFGNNRDSAKSCARIFICPLEWNELRHQLYISSKRFSKEAKETIISTKLGLTIQESGAVGLAMLTL
jgi:MYND finger